VMCDTFRPMFPTKAAIDMDDAQYPESWRADHHAPLQQRNGAGGAQTDAPNAPVTTWE